MPLGLACCAALALVPEPSRHGHHHHHRSHSENSLDMELKRALQPLEPSPSPAPLAQAPAEVGFRGIPSVPTGFPAIGLQRAAVNYTKYPEMLPPAPEGEEIPTLEAIRRVASQAKEEKNFAKPRDPALKRTLFGMSSSPLSGTMIWSPHSRSGVCRSTSGGC